jgi:hypothetical protein
MPIGAKVNIVLEDDTIRMFRGRASKARRILEIAGHLTSLFPYGSLFSLNKRVGGICNPSWRDG